MTGAAPPTIRASEIGEYVYCHRAWWLRRQGYESVNAREMAAGTALHERHGQAVIRAGCLSVLAYAFIVAALVVAAAYLTARWIA